MTMNRLIAFAIIALCSLATPLSGVAEENIATLRGNAALNQQGEAPVTAKPMKDDVKRHRNYPMQPP